VYFKQNKICIAGLIICCTSILFPHYGVANTFKKLPQIKYIYPQENQVVYFQNLQLNWQNIQGKSNQRLQISCSKNFEIMFMDTILNDHLFTIKSLKENKEYYWRILNESEKIGKQNYNDYSFFKTTSLLLQYEKNTSGLNLIPTYAGDQQLLLIDNPLCKNYSITIVNIEEKIRKIDRTTSSASQWIPTYKLPKGNYILRIHIPEQEYNNISEIMLTQNE
jgi:hypothetical protein